MKRKDVTTKEVLLACHRFHNEGDEQPFIQLMNKFNAPEKIVYAAMDRDCDNGLIEYGVSLATSWVTPKGYDFLKKEFNISIQAQ